MEEMEASPAGSALLSDVVTVVVRGMPAQAVVAAGERAATLPTCVPVRWAAMGATAEQVAWVAQGRTLMGVVPGEVVGLAQRGLMVAPVARREEGERLRLVGEELEGRTVLTVNVVPVRAMDNSADSVATASLVAMALMPPGSYLILIITCRTGAGAVVVAAVVVAVVAVAAGLLIRVPVQALLVPVAVVSGMLAAVVVAVAAVVVAVVVALVDMGEEALSAYFW